jgi:putative IMPACT (imprinted ancient) family translation regulator
VRAYGGAAAECLRTAPRRVLVDWREFDIHAAFEDTGAVHAALAAHGAQRLEDAFDADGLRVRVRLPADRVDALAAHLRDATRNRARIGDNG